MRRFRYARIRARFSQTSTVLFRLYSRAKWKGRGNFTEARRAEARTGRVGVGGEGGGGAVRIELNNP